MRAKNRFYFPSGEIAMNLVPPDDVLKLQQFDRSERYLQPFPEKQAIHQRCPFLPFTPAVLWLRSTYNINLTGDNWQSKGQNLKLKKCLVKSM